MSQSQQSIPRIVTLAEIEEVVSSRHFAIRLIDVIRQGFVSYSNGEFNACPIQTMGAPPMARFGSGTTDTDTDGNSNYSAQTCVKSGYVTSASHYVIKVASGGYPLPTNSGLMQLYSQQTGKLETILLDEGLLTELRTAAAGAVAAQMMAPNLNNCSSSIGILGTGIQARYQLRYLEHVTECRNVLVWGRTESNVKQFIHDMSKEGWKVQAVDKPDKLLDLCQLIVTTTSSREPILGKEVKGTKLQQLKPNKFPLHITCIGSDSTGKVELDEQLIAAADLLVADSRLQTKERGEFENAIAHGAVSLDNVVEIGELAQKEDLHRRHFVGDGEGNEDCRFTIFDSSGVAVQDCVVATMVNEAL